MPKGALTPTELKFKTAARLDIAPYNWIPPERLPLQPTASERIHYDDQGLNRCPVLRANPPERKANTLQLRAPVNQFDNIPNPGSNFEHQDPPPSVATLKRGAAVYSEPYQRMAATFQWIICRASALMADINDAVIGKKDYQRARRAYIQFLQNLNKHEFNKAAFTKADADKGIGLGANLHWIMLDPVITSELSKVTGEEHYFITGVTVMGQWNPHISSNGVPVPHS
jgi:hypothetical protein